MMSRWFTLKAPPVWHGDGHILTINDNEILLTPMSSEARRGKGLFVYNVLTNEWKKWIKYPNNFELHEHSVALSNNDEKIYVVGTMCLEGSGWNQLIIANTSNGKISNELENGWIYGDDDEDVGPDEFSAMSIIVNINGTMHIIGGWNNAKHFVYDETNNSLNVIHDFADSDNFTELYGFSLVYAASKGLLFLIGGGDVTRREVDNDKIRIYDVVKNEWSNIKGISMNIHNASAALSYNEEYIIIAGGTKKGALFSEHFDSIYILDIRNEGDYNIRKSSVVCPKPGPCCIARCGGNPKNKLLVFGYLRREFGYLDISKDMVQYIAMWYDQEMIHWIDNCIERVPKKGAGHVCVSLREILWS